MEMFGSGQAGSCDLKQKWTLSLKCVWAHGAGLEGFDLTQFGAVLKQEDGQD